MQFGHIKFNCRKIEVCTKCGQDHTDSQECKNEANVSIAKVSMYQMIKNVQNGKKKRTSKE